MKKHDVKDAEQELGTRAKRKDADARESEADAGAAVCDTMCV